MTNEDAANVPHVYADNVFISLSGTTVYLEFGRMANAPIEDGVALAVPVARVQMSPQGFHILNQLARQSLVKYEANYGELNVPEVILNQIERNQDPTAENNGSRPEGVVEEHREG